ncbi:MAG: hypothetical protein ACYCW6_12500 [Candidatus Xenobia bacterium]
MRLVMVLVPLCALALLMLRVPRSASAELWNGHSPPPIDLQPHAHTAVAYFGMG